MTSRAAVPHVLAFAAAALAATAVGPAALCAQGGGGARSGRGSAAVAPLVELALADSAAAVLPTAVPAQSAVGLLVRLPHMTRGEYETTAAFRARVTAALPSGLAVLPLPLGDGVGPDAAAGRCAAGVRYDADRGAFLITLPGVSVDLTGSAPADVRDADPGDATRTPHALAVWCHAATVGRYRAANAFGVARVVERATVDRVDVTAAGLAHDDVYAPWVVPMPPAAAQAARPGLRLALLARLQPGPRGDVAEQAEHREGATLDDPRDVRARDAVLWADPAVLVVYDGGTGRVIARRPLARAEDVAEARGGALRRAAPIPDNQTYFEFQVEKQAATVPGSLSAQYPAALRATGGGDGKVTAQFAVDTTGRVDMSTWKVLESTNDLFAQAAKEGASKAKFYPAEIGGKKVRQLVELPFTFTFPR